MYTPFIGDEKRDIVEYTSLGAFCMQCGRHGMAYTYMCMSVSASSIRLLLLRTHHTSTPPHSPTKNTGFLGSPHTMVTYTRCMDSVLCVPLMIDAAVWCDYFARTRVPQDQVCVMELCTYNIYVCIIYVFR